MAQQAAAVLQVCEVKLYLWWICSEENNVINFNFFLTITDQEGF